MESFHHVAAIPYPARGHVNPMLALCRLLASRNVLVSMIVTKEWASLITSTTLPANLRLCPISNVLPSEHTRGNDLKGFFQAIFSKMEAPVEKLVQEMEPRVDSILADSFLGWAAEIATRRSIPVWSLGTQSATTFLSVSTYTELDAANKLSAVDFSDEENQPLAYLPRIPNKLIPGFQSNDSTPYIPRPLLEIFSVFPTAEGLLFTSFYELEKQVIDTIRIHNQVPIYFIGPSIPYMTLNDTATDTTISYLKWLDSQPVRSVLYIALGSFLPMTSPQMDEMEAGLRESGVRFLWVVRGAPKNIEESSTSLMVPWCDQLKVLCHPSIGGFLTHCGWNSTLEGVFAGVPMLTFPLIWDQYPNSKVIVDDWMVGLRLKDDVEDRVVGREEIARMVKELMDLDAEENMGMRRRAKELRDSCRKALEEDGSSSSDLNAFVQEMVGKKRSVDV